MRATSGEARWAGAVRYKVRGEAGYAGFELDGEHYRVGDTVLLKADDDDATRDYVARIESLWEDASGAKHLEARWYYAPEDTRAGRLRRHHKRELFESTHVDANGLETVQGKCAVLSWEEYRAWAAQPAAAGEADEAERTFVCRGTYNTRTHEVRPLRDTADADALAAHALAELPMLSDPTLASGADGAAEPAGAQPPLAPARRAHNPFADARACLLLNAPPARLPCRETERDKVLRWMRSAVAEGGTASPLYISGVPGTGKTATVREVCRLLRAEQARGLLPPFTCAEINGMRLPAPSHAYSLLWEVVSGACGGPRETASPTKAMQLLEAHFATASHFAKRQDETLGGQGGGGGGGGQGGGKRAKRARAVVILIADEIDYLVTRNQGLLYNLFEWSSRADAQLALVGISNTVDLPERLLPRLNSRMGLCRVPFLPYAHAELSQILKARLGELAVFEGSGLELAARKVASVSGDIRRALEICRRATELAEARTAAAADAAAEPPRRPTAKAAGAGADASAPSPARRGGGGAGDGSGTLATPPHAARKPHAATSLVAAPAPSVPSCEARVRIEDIDQAIRSLQTAAPVRVLRRLSCEQQLVLTAAQLEAERTGRQELPARAVLGRYAALCRLHGHAPASEAELRGCLGVLCGWQLLATLPPAAGAAAAMSCSSELDDLLRLGVQAEDLRLALRADGVNAIAKAVL